MKKVLDAVYFADVLDKLDIETKEDVETCILRQFMFDEDLDVIISTKSTLSDNLKPFLEMKKFGISLYLYPIVVDRSNLPLKLV